MGITNSNKEVNVSQITCGGTFQVTLGLSAAPDILENPVAEQAFRVTIL